MYVKEIKVIIMESGQYVHGEYEHTNRDNLLWKEQRLRPEGDYDFLHEFKWERDISVDKGVRTVSLSGLQKSSAYRVGFYELGTPEEDIPYRRLLTRGETTSIKYHCMKCCYT